MYSQGYTAYRNRYLDLKRMMIHGGFKEIVATDDNFLKGWRKISNPGQQNCGIFINDEQPNRLIKCDTTRVDLTKMADEISKQTKYKIFPEIYSITVFNGSNYTEMERFNGDLTDLIMHLLPKEILNRMGLSEDLKDDILFIYEAMIPKTSDREFFLRHFDNASMYLYEHPTANISEIPNFPAWKSEKNIKEEVQMFDKLSKRLHKSDVTYDQYKRFINRLIDELKRMIPEITKQIFMLQYELDRLGYHYGDYKYDNFGFTLSDKPKEHLGITWTNNKFYGRYYYVHILDWGSGLSKGVDNPIRYYNETQLFSVHGQYNLRTISDHIMNRIDGLDKYFPKEIINIITSDFKTEYDFPKKNFTTMDEIRQDIVSSERPVKLPSNYIYDQIDDRTYVIIAGSSGRNNFVRLVIEDGPKYVITYLNDKKEPATVDRLWPMGTVSTTSDRTAAALIQAAYE
jgi:hypothetical protein